MKSGVIVYSLLWTGGIVQTRLMRGIRNGSSRKPWLQFSSSSFLNSNSGLLFLQLSLKTRAMDVVMGVQSMYETILHN